MSILIDLGSYSDCKEIPRISKSWWAEMESGREGGHESRGISVHLHHRHQSIIVLTEGCVRSQDDAFVNWLLTEPAHLAFILG